MTWSEESLPAQVAIDRQIFTYALTAQDSADVWDVLDGMEDVFGLDLFEPVEADPDKVPGVIRIISYRPSWGGRPQSGEEPVSWEQDLGAWASGGRFQMFRSVRWVGREMTACRYSEGRIADGYPEPRTEFLRGAGGVRFGVRKERQNTA